MRVGICDDNKELCLKIKDALEREKIEISFIAYDGIELIKELRKESNLDLLIIDIVIPKLDGIEVLETVKREGINIPKVLVLTEIISEKLLTDIIELGVDYVMVKPIFIHSLTLRVLSLLGLGNPYKCNTNTLKENSTSYMSKRESSANLEFEISNTLIKLGITPKNKGFSFIRDALKITIKDKSALASLSKIIYPEIAEKYSTTVSNVERLIRFTIKRAWEGDKSKDFHFLFGSEGGKNTNRPTNLQFIAYLTERLILENNELNSK